MLVGSAFATPNIHEALKNPSAITGHETKITGDTKDDRSEDIFK